MILIFVFFCFFSLGSFWFLLFCVSAFPTLPSFFHFSGIFFLSSFCRKDCFKTDAISCPLCGDFSLMCLYNCSCHRKADSIAAAFPGPRRIRTVEAVKEAVEITFRQGIAGILHRKFCFFAVFSPENVDFSTLRSVFNGVIHKKRNELVDSCGIPFHMEFFCNIALQRAARSVS